jgi:hypothetical protein
VILLPETIVSRVYGGYRPLAAPVPTNTAPWLMFFSTSGAIGFLDSPTPLTATAPARSPIGRVHGGFGCRLLCRLNALDVAARPLGLSSRLSLKQLQFPRFSAPHDRRLSSGIPGIFRLRRLRSTATSVLVRPALYESKWPSRRTSPPKTTLTAPITALARQCGSPGCCSFGLFCFCLCGCQAPDHLVVWNPAPRLRRSCAVSPL